MNKNQSRQSYIYRAREGYDDEFSSSSNDSVSQIIARYAKSVNRSSAAGMKSRPLTERKRLSSNQNLSAAAGLRASSKTPRETHVQSAGFEQSIRLRKASSQEKISKSHRKQQSLQLNSQRSLTPKVTKKDQKLYEMEERVRNMQEHELDLIRELSEQQKIAKNALNKLYDVKDNPTEEAEHLKQYYKDYYARKMEEERSHSQLDIRKLKYENEKLLLELNNFQNDRYTEKTAASRRLEAELISTTSEVNQKTQENLDLRTEIARLKQKFIAVESEKDKEIQRLKQTIVMLEDQNVQIKLEFERADSEYGRNEQLEKRVYELEKELRFKTDEFDRKAENLKQREYIAHQRVDELQKQAILAIEYKNTIQDLRKSLAISQDEIIKVKNFYEEKLQRKRLTQESQRSEWSEIYNQLRRESKFLKSEIDSLVNQKSKSPHYM